MNKDPESLVIRHVPTKAEIVAAATELQALPQTPMPLTHRFAPGLYVREIFMPKDTFVIGHEHKTEHFNVVLTGRARVLCEGKVLDLKAGDVFVSGPGAQKVLLIQEDMRFLTLHPTTETDVPTLEALLVNRPEPSLTAAMVQQLTQGNEPSI